MNNHDRKFRDDERVASSGELSPSALDEVSGGFSMLTLPAVRRPGPVGDVWPRLGPDRTFENDVTGYNRAAEGLLRGIDDHRTRAMEDWSRAMTTYRDGDESTFTPEGQRLIASGDWNSAQADRYESILNDRVTQLEALNEPRLNTDNLTPRDLPPQQRPLPDELSAEDRGMLEEMEI